jgi:hypothetical protein
MTTEIVKFTKKTNGGKGRKKQQKKQRQVVVRQNGRRRKRNGSNKKSNGGNRQAKLVKYYMDRFTHAGQMDLSPLPTSFGTQPVIPSVSSGTTTYIETASANAALWYMTGFNSSDSGLYYSDVAASVATAFGASTANVPLVFTFPDSVLGNIRVTGLCMKAMYTGPPLSAQGMALVGARPYDSSSAAGAAFSNNSFNSLANLPGVKMFPIAELTRGEICSAGMPVGVDWQGIYAQRSSNSQWQLPFVCVTGLPVGGSLFLSFYRTIECVPGNQSTLVALTQTAPVGRQYRNALEDALESLGTQSSHVLKDSANALIESLGAYAPTIVGNVANWAMGTIAHRTRHNIVELIQ